MPEPLPPLQPGDVLLYRGTGFWSWWIRTKTWSPVSHCEGLVSPTEVVAARQEGVRRYPFRRTHLYGVVRPEGTFDLAAAMQWFVTEAEGQGYDWWGLANFINWRVGAPERKQFCSELLVRWFRAGGLHPFHDAYAPDKTSPGMFLSSPHFQTVWLRDEEG